ncbi:MAG: glycerophosphodiester phosphodiesterase [Oceanospirillaceae bacterium]|nr:glycerophosphodiester phosphodiesterase [Oceanospirillaceae bacterium]
MINLHKILCLVFLSALLAACGEDDNKADTQAEVAASGSNIQVGVRPYYLINEMPEGALKTKLQNCSEGPFKKSEFSIGHRGAAMQFPEHSKESYLAAARMGAGIIECDVTFTKDKELVCRHSQCDLHTTTDILAHPELAAKCSQPFTPYDAESNTPASAQCCTSDITLAEFKTLKAKMDGFNPKASTVAEYMQGTPDWRTDAYASNGTLMTHAESIALFKSLNVKMTPELKSASVTMPFNGMSQAQYAQKMLDEYKNAAVPASQVFAQSFDKNDIDYWITNEPEFGAQAVYLDDADTEADLPDANTLNSYAAQGIKYVAPPMWALVALNGQQEYVPSAYAENVKAAGLNIITWTLERSGPLKTGGGWYYQSISEGTQQDGDMYRLLDVLAQDVGIKGIFSDWPATVTYYANCMGL